MNRLEYIYIYISPDRRSPNYRALDARKKLVITLYYLKDPGSINQTANLFGVNISTVSETVTAAIGKQVYSPSEK